MANDRIARRRRRAVSRARLSLFIRRNALYIGVGLCLAVLGGLFSLGLGKDGGTPPEDAPAEHSMDERLQEAEGSTPAPWSREAARRTQRPAASTAAPLTPAPTLTADLTPAPSFSPAPVTERWNPPVDGRLIRVYSMDGLIWSKTLKQWMTHSGVDIAARKDSEVRSVAAGTVERVYNDDMMGTTVVIDHGNGVKTACSGLREDPPVTEGQRIEARALIGLVGSTAISECAEESHIHFEVLKDGRPVDPEGFVLLRRLDG